MIIFTPRVTSHYIGNISAVWRISIFVYPYDCWSTFRTYQCFRKHTNLHTFGLSLDEMGFNIAFEIFALM